MIEVYHNKNFLDRQWKQDDMDLIEDLKNHSKCVARVDTDDLDVAYEKTNHITQPWDWNEGVIALHGGGRSTSVGDFMWTTQGVVFVVDMVGFRKLDVVLGDKEGGIFKGKTLEEALTHLGLK